MPRTLKQDAADFLDFLVIGMRPGERRHARTTSGRDVRILRESESIFTFHEMGVGSFTLLRFTHAGLPSWVVAEVPSLRHYLEPIPHGFIIRSERDPVKYAEIWLNKLNEETPNLY